MLDEVMQPSATEPTLTATVTRASQQNDAWAGADSARLLDASGEAQLISLDDPRYPRSLRYVTSPPPHLHVLGSTNQLGDDAAIAIVGSRQASQHGRRVAHKIAAALAQQGHTIVSGLAAGVDAAAHRGALACGGRTVAVVGTGVDHVYPPSNRDLYESIASAGAVVSQFALGHRASKTTFPARNVLIAGLSRASLLVELDERSGTRIEANITLEQGKPVLLWAPILEEAQWAREFARHHLVSFVATVDDIVAAIPSDHES